MNLCGMPGQEPGLIQRVQNEPVGWTLKSVAHTPERALLGLKSRSAALRRGRNLDIEGYCAEVSCLVVPASLL